MSGTGYAIAATAIVVVGDTLSGKGFEAKKVVGAGVATLFVAGLDSFDDLIGTRFGQLFLLGVALVYLSPLLESLGVTGKKATS